MVVDDIKIAALGGDRRQTYALASLLQRYGNAHISVLGLPLGGIEGARGAASLEEALLNADLILLPFPTSVDGVRINCPLDREGELSSVKLTSVVRLAKPGTVVVGGKIPAPFLTSAEEKGLIVRDLLSIEAFEMKNAYITAEAALSVAMNSLTKSIFGAGIVVTGFGRISKHLSRLLSLLGAKVCVAARKESDLAFAETLGYKTLRIDGERWSDALLCGYDAIYNTVPQRIFDKEFLRRVDKRTLLVELASVPGGFDISAAQELGSNISWALSLPGKYAPESAGAIISECIVRIIEEVAGL